MVRFMFVFALVSATVSTARADQCQLVDVDAATWAAQLLKGATVVSFCANCGDKAPGKPEKVTRVSVKVDGTDREVEINGKGIDLAYTYMQTGKTTFTNLAAMVGCTTTGVKPFVTVVAKPALPALGANCKVNTDCTPNFCCTLKDGSDRVCVKSTTQGQPGCCNK